MTKDPKATIEIKVFDASTENKSANEDIGRC